MKTTRRPQDAPGRTRWLLLVHQLPASPSRARVKTWRRLQQLGAVAVRNGTYVLPDSAQAREDFEWMKTEILANKGEVTVFAADTVDTLAHDEIVAAFRRDRERAYTAIRQDAGDVERRLRHGSQAPGAERQQALRAVRQLRDRLAQATSNDFFGAPGRGEADAAVAALERHNTRGRGEVGAPTAAHPVLRGEDYRGRTWLTRPRPGIDRGGSAWLIRRFVDPKARFVFGERPGTASTTVPFDMYGVEFSHEGEHCTFEVLAARFDIRDAAVAQIGRLVHDLDLKESRYEVPEASSVGRLIEGLRQAFTGNAELLEQEIVLFEALYRSYSTEQTGKRRLRRPIAASRSSTRRKGR